MIINSNTTYSFFQNKEHKERMMITRNMLMEIRLLQKEKRAIELEAQESANENLSLKTDNNFLLHENASLKETIDNLLQENERLSLKVNDTNILLNDVMSHIKEETERINNLTNDYLRK